MQLVVCACCRRHVRAGDPRCPFCGREVDAAPIAAPRGRTSRAHLWIAAAALAGCTKPGDAAKGEPVTADPQASASATATAATSSVTPSASASAVASASASANGETFGGEIGGLLGLGTVGGGDGGVLGHGTAMAAAYGAPPPSGASLDATKGPRADILGVEAPDVAVARRILAANRARFRACYTTALKFDPAVAGELRVALSVAADGSVKSASAVSSTVPKSVDACALGIARTLSFPESGAAATVKATIAFRQ